MPNKQLVKTQKTTAFCPTKTKSKKRMSKNRVEANNQINPIAVSLSLSK